MRVIGFLVCVWMISQNLLAQTDASRFPPVLSEYLPSNYHLTRLPNGLEVLVIEDKSLPLTTVGFTVRCGAFAQSKEYEGTVALLEHLFFKPTRNSPNREQYFDQLNLLGMETVSQAGQDFLQYSASFPKENLMSALRVFRESAENPAYDTLDILREKQNIARKIQRKEANPSFFLMQDLQKQLWGNFSPRKNLTGNFSIINQTKSEDLFAIHNRYFYPNNSLLTIIGDLNYTDAFLLADSAFGKWKQSSFDIYKQNPIPDPVSLKDPKFFSTVSEFAQEPAVVIAWQGPDTRSKLHFSYTGEVFARLLSLRNSQIQKKLVRSGLANRFQVQYQAQKFGAPIQFVFYPQPGKLTACVDTLFRELLKFTKPAAFSQDELEAAREQLLADLVYQTERAGDKALAIGRGWAIAGCEFTPAYEDSIRNVTTADLALFVKEYVAAKPYSLGILSSSAALKTMDFAGLITKKLNDWKGIKPAETLAVKPIAADTIDVTKFVIYFRMNQTILDSAARHALKMIHALMKSDPYIHLFVNGHTDSQGTESYNLLLSRKRAQSVKDYLVSQYKIAENRIFVVGFGESKLAVKNDVTEELKSKNRRVEFSSRKLQEFPKKEKPTEAK